MKYFFIGAVATVCSFAWIPRADAQVVQAGSIYEFGDSFQDARYDCAVWSTPLGVCSNYRNTPMQLGAISPYQFVQTNDFAIGGTAAGPGTKSVALSYPVYPDSPAGTYPNMFGQISEFQALGRTIGASDLVSISFAGNDITASYAVTVGAGLGYTVAGYISTDVGNLIALGGRNFILFGGMPFDRMTLGGFSLANLVGVANSADNAYYTTLNSVLPATLAPYESTSVHLRILDVNTLANRVLDEPSMYGFISGDCYGISGCTAAPLSVQNQYAFYRGHPSDAFALIIAKYIQNLLNSAYQVPAQSDLAAASAQAFSSSLLARLNNGRLRAAKVKAAQAADSAGNMPAKLTIGKLSLFLAGNYNTGTRKDGTNTYGMDWNQGEGIAGAEYLAAANLRLGLAAGYARPTSDLNAGMGTIAFDSYQLAGYASFNSRHWFADAVLSGALNRYSLRRPGVIGSLTSSPDGSSFAADAQGGYLFDLKALRVGPIAGLTYAHVSVDSYHESGDIVLAQIVGRQRSATLLGRAGLQLSASLHGLTSFLNVTDEHYFSTGSRVITTTGEDPNSALPVHTPVSSLAGTYGKLVAGVDARLSRNKALDLTFDTTFSRKNGNQRGVTGTVSIAF